jgi:hypothetical protein
MNVRDSSAITIVSGLPRSGTSLMMSMLDAGGMPLLIDHIRQADDDNPKGYYEFERVKKLKADRAWLPDAQGKAVKIISALLSELPPEYRYKIIFMQRAMQEVLASQRRMLTRRGEHADGVGDEAMAAIFSRHLQHVERWLAQRPNMAVLYVNYARLVQSPAQFAHAVNAFLGGGLNEQKMIAAVDPSLHRQHASG